MDRRNLNILLLVIWVVAALLWLTGGAPAVTFERLVALGIGEILLIHAI